ncbi:MAG: acyltransferase family protein [Henriciella sp.]|nr:acyltransferase family protein [Henriciella sp.]
MTHKTYYPVLDSLRGVAAFGVLFFHLSEWTHTRNWFPRGELAVDFFFCLSGFVMAHAYAKRLGGDMSFGKFVEVRMIRLYPLIGLSVLVATAYTLAKRFTDADSASVAEILTAAVTGLLLLPHFFAPEQLAPSGEIYPLNGPLWSLFFELAVNIAWALAFVWLTVSRTVWIAVVAAVGMLCSGLYFSDFLLGEQDYNFIWGTFRVTYSFAAGLLIHHLYTARNVRLEASYGLIAVLLIGAMMLPRFGSGIVFDAVFVFLLSPLIVLAGAHIDGRGASLGRSRLLGELSYPIYVLHFPIFMWANGTLQSFGGQADSPYAIGFYAVVIVLGAWIAMVLFDRPVRRLLVAYSQRSAQRPKIVGLSALARPLGPHAFVPVQSCPAATGNGQSSIDQVSELQGRDQANEVSRRMDSSVEIRKDAASEGDTIKVFAHLAHGQDVVAWEKMWSDGVLVGINDPTPYGYGRANQMGCEVSFSEAAKGSKLYAFIRLVLRVLLGFDYIQARHNAKRALEADIIWTHTESQYLAMALVFALRGKNKPRPLLLGQSVWFFDKWPKLDPIRKAFYRYLINYVDVLTVHSPLNLERAKDLFPGKRIELVRFGIPSEDLTKPQLRENEPHRIICVGNDRHRDWQTAIEAFKDEPGIDVKIFSTKTNPKLADGIENVEIRGVRNDAELKAELSTASLMVLPLKPNLHASGATVLQESAIFGIPVVASHVGGLEAYFDAEAVTYIPHGSPEALKLAAMDLLNDPVKAVGQATKAYERVKSGAIGANAYVMDHVRISRELLAEKD